ncbi:MAG: 50S ribosomal protein L25 [Candidatus Zixiibacteriota bacterium]|nr:MAG: 50S ribosomal protein L25 [candidate division Zixibacteria bacterium]
MKEILIAAEKRDKTGKGANRQTRKDGNIPGVVYGPKQEPIPIYIDEPTLHQAFKSAAGSTALYDLEIENKKNKVIVREMQRDPVTSKIIHIDFYAVSMTKPINLAIPIHFEGIPVGVTVDGGIMQTNMRELEISCLPDQIPEFCELNVTELSIGDSIHVEDINIEGIDILSDANKTVVVISAPTIVKVDEPTAEEGEELAEGEVAEGAEGEAAVEGEAAEGKTKEDSEAKSKSK